MDYTFIKNIKKRASVIGLGTWSMGGSLWGGTNEEEAVKTLLEAFDKGINLIDTAPAYGKGISEKIVAKAIKLHKKRDNLIVVTKCGLNQETENTFRDSRKEFLKKELENSLKRLEINEIDLYLIHWPDPTTPIQEAAETLNQFIKEGKIKAVGVCNYSVAEMEEFQKYAPLSVSQSPFNLFESEIEQSIIPFCKKNHLGLLGYSPLCRGLLSGKMSKSREFKGDDLRKDMDKKFSEPNLSRYLSCTEALKKWVEEKYNRPLIALAVRWALEKGIDVVLWGARKPNQLDEVEKVFGWKLTTEDLKEIDKIVKSHIPEPIPPAFMAPPVRK